MYMIYKDTNNNVFNKFKEEVLNKKIVSIEINVDQQSSFLLQYHFKFNNPKIDFKETDIYLEKDKAEVKETFYFLNIIGENKMFYSIGFYERDVLFAIREGRKYVMELVKNYCKIIFFNGEENFE